MAPKLELKKHTTKLMCINEVLVETSPKGFALKNLDAENVKCVFKVANVTIKLLLYEHFFYVLVSSILF